MTKIRQKLGLLKHQGDKEWDKAAGNGNNTVIS